MKEFQGTTQAVRYNLYLLTYIERSARSSYSLVIDNPMSKNGPSVTYKNFQQGFNNFNIYEGERRLGNLLVWSGKEWEQKRLGS